jgi:DNA repair photolyase
LSIGTLERDVWQLTEPGAPPPDQRLEALRRLSEAGIRCGVLIAPVLPGLSDSDDQLRAVAQACLEAGAVSVTPVALHLRPGVREHYLGWLARTRPELAELYAQRFRKGSYQPRAEQHHISEVVRAVQEAGGRDYPKHRPSGHEPTGRPREAPPQRVRPVNEQLRLL